MADDPTAESVGAPTGATALEGVPGTRFGRIWLVDSTGSTNADLLAAARAGSDAEVPGRFGAPGSVLIAGHQTRGRGRQGRTWLDRPGSSLLCSALLDADPSWASLVPLATGLGVVDGVAEICGVAVGLKWPNDVLHRDGERKLCGILAEARTMGSRLAVVTGFGCNLDFGDAVPPDVRERAVDLASLVRASGSSAPLPTNIDLARVILGRLDHWLGRLESGQRAAVLAAYRSVCLTIGRSVRFETPTGVVEGRATEVDDDGALVVTSSDGRWVLTAGDAHHL